MTSRISKVILVCAAALFSSLVAFNNITDYNSNFMFVKHVLSMDTIFPGSNGMWRSMTENWIHHSAYTAIIVTEVIIALTCWLGAWKLWKNRLNAITFNRAKGFAVAGLTLGIALWFVGFIVVGGEWFLMWQSTTWNGQQAASNFSMILGIILIYLNMPDHDDSSV